MKTTGGGQLPNPDEWNSTLTSATKRGMLTPNHNEWNSTLTSETKNVYPYLYIDLGKWVADLGKWVAGYELSMRFGDDKSFLCKWCEG